MAIELMNGSLLVDVFYDKRDIQYEDNICLCIKEHSPEDEKVFYANETNLLITSDEARELSKLLMEAADQSNHASR